MKHSHKVAALVMVALFTGHRAAVCNDGSCGNEAVEDEVTMLQVNIQQHQQQQIHIEKSAAVPVERLHDSWRCAPIQKNLDGIYEVSGVCGNGVNSTYQVWMDEQKWYPGSPSEELLYIPLAQLRKEHGEQNLYELFGRLNDWITTYAMWNVTYMNDYDWLVQNMVTSQGDKYPDPVDMTFSWDGHVIHTRQDHDCQAGDDPYCYANGWMKGQNPELNPATFNDFEAYDSFTKSQCRAMNEKYDFDGDNITMFSHIMEDNYMYEMTDNACNLMHANGTLPTDRDFQKHAYVKCLMDFAHMEVAYCYFRGCVLENNRIGHGDDCDY